MDADLSQVQPIMNVDASLVLQLLFFNVACVPKISFDYVKTTKIVKPFSPMHGMNIYLSNGDQVTLLILIVYKREKLHIWNYSRFF